MCDDCVSHPDAVMRRTRLAAYQLCLSIAMDYNSRDAIIAAIARQHDRTACDDCDTFGNQLADDGLNHVLDDKGRPVPCEHPNLTDEMRMEHR